MTEPAFATITSLLPHQRPAIAKMLPIRVGALFMDMGLGKTRTTIELAHQRLGKWDRLFWFTPCSLRHNVRAEWLRHTDKDPAQIVIWDGPALDRGISPESTVHIIGLETMGSSDRAAVAYQSLVTTRAFVVVDESSYIKGFLAKRSQRVTLLSAKSRYRVILTGTPFTQGAVDLYSQMRFLSPKILGYNSFWSFAANHLEYEVRKVRRRGVKREIRTNRIIRTHNPEYLAAKIAPYVYQVKKEECLDLPEKLFSSYHFNLSNEQHEAYEYAKTEFLNLEYEDWRPIDIFRLFSRLQGIVCGFETKKHGEKIALSHSRIDLLCSVVAEIPTHERVIVWAKYHYALREIVAALAEDYGEDAVCPYFGGMNDRQRAESLARWREKGRFLVATQSIASHGLTLTEAAYAVFYADGFKYSERLQAEDRIHRIGQSRRPLYITLVADKSIDERIQSALTAKGNALDAFQEQVNQYRERGIREKARELVKNL